jgi:UPF0271 protein
LRRSIDLNCDMGEIPEAIADGTQESLMPNLTSVSIACGGHAGDEQMMKATIEQAIRWKLGVGAHPGYADRENFGRKELNIPPEAIADSVYEQIRRFAGVAASCGVVVAHVKAHGALYNQAARDRAIAQAFADGVARWSHEVVLMGLAGSLMLDVFRDAGFNVAAEAFADRRYESDGTLRSRKFDDALIRNPAEAAQQALRIVEQGTAQTICIHGDTPGAPKIAEAVAKYLREAGVELRTLGDSLRTAS